MFDWPQFLATHGVAFSRLSSEVTLHCPYCGQADRSEHLSISLKGAGWRCFRNRAHAGRSRSKLIQALLNVPLDEARRLAGEDTFTPSPPDADFAAHIAGLLWETPATAPVGPLTFPTEFKPLRPLAPMSHIGHPFWDYLRDTRKFSFDDGAWVAETYNLHYAARGPYRYRLIIPVYDAEGQLKTWTARSILPDEPLRYKTLPVGPRKGEEGPFAAQGPGSLLLGLPLLLRLPNPEVLVLCEGPFDAFRITALGRQFGVYGTCLFGLNVSDAQINLLERLMTRFKRLVLLLDPDQEFLPWQVQGAIRPMHVHIGKLPEGVDDPGDLPYAVGKELVQSWLL
jgi:hypothetical protein